jgi:hypothetical protein
MLLVCNILYAILIYLIIPDLLKDAVSSSVHNIEWRDD